MYKSSKLFVNLRDKNINKIKKIYLLTKLYKKIDILLNNNTCLKKLFIYSNFL